MLRPLAALFLLLSAFPLAATPARAAEPQRWAVLVGVGDNIDPRNVLQGPANDVAAMSDLLRGRYRFPASHVHALLDSKATRAEILAQWEWLIREAKPGDQVVFYYSGHGIDIPDPLKPSGRDSAICPYDARQVTGLIPGREIGKRIDRLRTDQVVVIVDACCSSTATRDIRSHKRSPEPSTLGLLPTPILGTAQAEALENTPIFAESPAGSPQKERYIGAAAIDQGAHECDFGADEGNEGGNAASVSPGARAMMGALTFYLLKELRADPAGALSYRAVIDRVRGDLAAKFTADPQEAQISGPGLDTPFLALPADFVAPPLPLPLPLPIAAARSAGGVGTTVTLRAVAGATLVAGAILQGGGGKQWTESGETMPARDTKSSAVIRLRAARGLFAEGVVLAGAVYSGMSFTEVMRPEPNATLRVAIIGEGNRAERLRSIVARLARLASIVAVPPTQSSDVTLYPSLSSGAGPDRVDVFRNGVGLPPIDESRVSDVLTNMQQVKQLADLWGSPDASLHVSVCTTTGESGYVSRKVGDTFDYRITVDRDAYITILDIAADGTVTGDSERAKAGEPLTLSGNRVTGPVGLDTLKVIATTFPFAPALPGTAAEREALGRAGRPEAIARNVVNLLRSQANVAARTEAKAKALDFVARRDDAKTAITSQNWATADMLLRIDAAQTMN